MPQSPNDRATELAGLVAAVAHVLQGDAQALLHTARASERSLSRPKEVAPSGATTAELGAAFSALVQCTLVIRQERDRLERVSTPSPSQ
jgi:hypothetical protein